jgi:hypothetical protein
VGLGGRGIDRRSFLGVGAGAAFVCTIGGERVVLRAPEDGRLADAAARKVSRPVSARAAQAAGGPFPSPEPAPGGKVREYWIQATSARWDVAPTGRDEWHDRAIRGPRKFRAFVYQLMTPGFDRPAGGARIPGPLLFAEVGDVLVVHFRNAEESAGQALTMHPHGVRYTPDYDGHVPRRVHPRGRLRRPGRGVHVPLGGDAGLRRRLAVPRPRARTTR